MTLPAEAFVGKLSFGWFIWLLENQCQRELRMISADIKRCCKGHLIKKWLSWISSEDWPASKPSCYMGYLPGTDKPNGPCSFPWDSQPVSLQRSNSGTNHYCGYKYYISLFIFSLAFSSCRILCQPCKGLLLLSRQKWNVFSLGMFSFPLIQFKWAIRYETNRVSESVFWVFSKSLT